MVTKNSDVTATLKFLKRSFSMDDDSSYNVDEQMTIVPLMIVFNVNAVEYSKAELDARDINNVDDESDSELSSEENLDSSHLENMHWSTCQESYHSLLKCFRESISLLNDKLEGIRCITSNKGL